MKISKLQKSLQMMLERVGDVEVKMLDDESGNMEPVECVFHFKVGAHDEEHVELATANQCGDI